MAAKETITSLTEYANKNNWEETNVVDFLNEVTYNQEILVEDNKTQNGKGHIVFTRISERKPNQPVHIIITRSTLNDENYVKKMESVLNDGRYIMTGTTSYGRNRSKDGTLSINFIAMDFDDVSAKELGNYINDAESGEVPMPTFVNFSGGGAHLIFQLDKPITTRSARSINREYLTLNSLGEIMKTSYYPNPDKFDVINSHFTRPFYRILSKYTNANLKSLSAFQGFTIPGSRVKPIYGDSLVKMFKPTESRRYSITELTDSVGSPLSDDELFFLEDDISEEEWAEGYKNRKTRAEREKELLERLEKDKEKYTPEIAKDYNGEKTIDEFRNSPLFVTKSIKGNYRFDNGLSPCKLIKLYDFLMESDVSIAGKRRQAILYFSVLIRILKFRGYPIPDETVTEMITNLANKFNSFPHNNPFTVEEALEVYSNNSQAFVPQVFGSIKSLFGSIIDLPDEFLTTFKVQKMMDPPTPREIYCKEVLPEQNRRNAEKRAEKTASQRYEVYEEFLDSLPRENISKKEIMQAMKEIFDKEGWAFSIRRKEFLDYVEDYYKRNPKKRNKYTLRGEKAVYERIASVFLSPEYIQYGKYSYEMVSRKTDIEECTMMRGVADDTIQIRADLVSTISNLMDTDKGESILNNLKSYKMPAIETTVKNIRLMKKSDVYYKQALEVLATKIINKVDSKYLRTVRSGEQPALVDYDSLKRETNNLCELDWTDSSLRESKKYGAIEYNKELEIIENTKKLKPFLKNNLDRLSITDNDGKITLNYELIKEYIANSKETKKKLNMKGEHQTKLWKLLKDTPEKSIREAFESCVRSVE
jgi:hypothetical protein